MAKKSKTSTVDLQQFLTVAFAACDGASQILNRYFGNLRHVDEKFQAGLVSEADKESEKFIVELIRKSFPDHAILGEESGLSGRVESGQVPTSGPLWMIDPLDGTTNYVHQFPIFCISIGLEIDGELVVGVVDAPKMGRRYHAVKGGGAFLNGEKIKCSPRTSFRDGLFATGFFETDNSLEEQLDLVSSTVKNSRGVRRAGAAAMDLCFVRRGNLRCVLGKKSQPLGYSGRNRHRPRSRSRHYHDGRRTVQSSSHFHRVRRTRSTPRASEVDRRRSLAPQISFLLGRGFRTRGLCLLGIEAFF